MARFLSRIAGGTAILAALFMASTPVAAAALPHAATPVTAAQATGKHGVPGVENADWRGRGYGRHHRGRGVDGGDILAGVLILGGIAAIASAASNAGNSRDDYPYEEPYPDYRPDYNDSRSYMGNGIDNAVDMCVGEVERGNERVAAVDNAARTGDGWRISGQMDAGGNFSCWIDNNGRIRSVDLGGGYYGASSDYPGGYSQDVQWDDDTYARARAQSGYADPAAGGTSDYYYEGAGG